jgi:hypothetical protein
MRKETMTTKYRLVFTYAGSTQRYHKELRAQTKAGAKAAMKRLMDTGCDYKLGKVSFVGIEMPSRNTESGWWSSNNSGDYKLTGC